MRFRYIDDSGAESTGWVVYGWLEMSVDNWHPALRRLLELRKQLHTTYNVSPTTELHCTKYFNGRSRISDGHSGGYIDPQKLGKDVAQDVLQALGELRKDGIAEFGLVARQTSMKGKNFRREKAEVYEALVRRWDASLKADNTFGMIHMDGDGTDPAYYQGHRMLKLDSPERRRVIEDPLFHDSQRSQLVQAADHVAYFGYRHLLADGRVGVDYWKDHLANDDVTLGITQL